MSQAGCLRLVVSERWVIVSGWLSHGQVKMVLWWREKFGVHSIVYLNYFGDADAPLARLLALQAASATRDCRQVGTKSTGVLELLVAACSRDSSTSINVTTASMSPLQHPQIAARDSTHTPRGAEYIYCSRNCNRRSTRVCLS